ncbi:MAG: Holliday junction branch migration protein RuvA [Dehalococcoidia bacterium]|jgi:Holliday junction DNA helicase RuvA|nr:Holliday junction branch migration protein RuvA [Dehalococcoidia bacterium]
MIHFLEGVVDSRGVDHVVLNVGGIGFLVKTSSRTAEEAGPLGAEAVLHTCLLVREENPVLYGFAAAEERALFLELISVTGVGPKVALSLLGAMRPGELARAVVSGDTALLSKIPGVGKKTAARLCVDLASKLDAYVGTDGGVTHLADAELVEALTALGYTAREAMDAARKVETGADAPLELRLRKALQALSAR